MNFAIYLAGLRAEQDNYVRAGRPDAAAAVAAEIAKVEEILNPSPSPAVAAPAAAEEGETPAAAATPTPPPAPSAKK